MTDMLIIDTGAGMLYAPDFAAAAKLHAAIAAAYNEIGAVEKLGTNKDQNYKYIAYDDVAVVARKALGKQGLALYCGVCENGVSQTPSASGKSLITRLTLRFVLCESTTGAMLISDWESEAADSGLADKGINKALTAAQKYYLMRLLMLSTKEDDDPDQHGDEGDQRRAQPQQVVVASTAKPQRPADPETVKGWLLTKIKDGDPTIATDGLRGATVGSLHMLFPDDNAETKAIKRHALTTYIFGVAESAKLTAAQCQALAAWATTPTPTGVKANEFAKAEAAKIIESLAQPAQA